MKAKRNTVAAELKKRIGDDFGRARESMHSLLLAGLGAIGRAQQARKDRFAELVAEGRKVEPRVKKAIGDLRGKIQGEGRFGFKSPAWLDRSKLRSFIDEHMGRALQRTGLPTRKEVEALSRKVDKLIELQRA